MILLKKTVSDGELYTGISKTSIGTERYVSVFPFSKKKKFQLSGDNVG